MKPFPPVQVFFLRPGLTDWSTDWRDPSFHWSDCIRATRANMTDCGISRRGGQRRVAISGIVRRSAWSLIALIGCASLSGCHLYYHERSAVLSNAIRTVIEEPSAFLLHKNDYRTRLRNYALACRVWRDVLSASGESNYSSHYARGFREGFADYLYAGGTGQPPPVPPRSYWKVGYETPAGKAAIEDWFNGFRHGAAACRDGGYRQFATVPSSLGTSRFLVDHDDRQEQEDPRRSEVIHPIESTVFEGTSAQSDGPSTADSSQQPTGPVREIVFRSPEKLQEVDE